MTAHVTMHEYLVKRRSYLVIQARVSDCWFQVARELLFELETRNLKIRN